MAAHELIPLPTSLPTAPPNLRKCWIPGSRYPWEQSEVPSVIPWSVEVARLLGNGRIGEQVDPVAQGGDTGLANPPQVDPVRIYCKIVQF